MSQIKPFFINSNICTDNDDISTLDNFMNSVAGNIGNSYITYALIKTIFGGLVNINHIKNIYNYDFSKQDRDIDLINNECSHVFLILQDQIRINESYNLKLPYLNLINFIKKLNKPIIIAGLGANSLKGYDINFHTKLDTNLINFLKQLAEYTEIIGVRGYFTQEILSNLGINNTEVIGCPSYYEMGRDRIISKKEYSKDFKVLFSNELYNDLGKRSNIILQDEKKLIDIIAFQQNYYVNLTHNQLYVLLQKKFYTFSDIKSWKAYVSQFDFLLGQRLHGAILALNSGVCSIIMNSDSRSMETSEYFKIPYHPNLLNEKNIEKIYEQCNYEELNKKYPILYNNYMEFLSKNNLHICDIEDSRDKISYIEQPKLNIYNKFTRIIFILKIKNYMESIFSIKTNINNIVLRIFGFKITFKKCRKENKC